MSRSVSKLEDSFQRRIKELVDRVSGWTILALVLFLYPGIGLLLPLLLGFPKVFLIEFNLTGVVMAMALGVGWLDKQLKTNESGSLIGRAIFDCSIQQNLSGSSARCFVEKVGRLRRLDEVMDPTGTSIWFSYATVSASSSNVSDGSRGSLESTRSGTSQEPS